MFRVLWRVLGGFAAGCGVVRGVGRPPRVFLFSGLSCSVRRRGLSRGRMVLLRLSVRFSLSPMVSFRLSGLSWPGRAPLLLALLGADRGRGVCSSKLGWSAPSGRVLHPPFRDCTGRRMRPCVPPSHHPPFMVFWGRYADVSGPTHTKCGGHLTLGCGQAATGALELRPSGARQHPDGTAQTPCNITKTITKKERTP